MVRVMFLALAVAAMHMRIRVRGYPESGNEVRVRLIDAPEDDQPYGAHDRRVNALVETWRCS